MRHMSEPDIDDVKDLDGHVRLIVLHETEPFSDTYMQVMMPREAFTAVSDAAFECQPDSTRTPGTKRIRVVYQAVKIPNAKEHYTPEEMAEYDKGKTL